jgi:hypothetical protein
MFQIWSDLDPSEPGTQKAYNGTHAHGPFLVIAWLVPSAGTGKPAPSTHKKAVLRIYDILVWVRIWSADPWLWLMDPDPAIFIIGLQDANKKLI